jgi:hypothetical protein
MNRDSEGWIWIAAGSLGAMGLGIVLIPLRSVTSASNLAFAFVAFTIIVAELGGRAAGLATAVVSAMSLNFFLTQPYLTMAISKPEDIVAFFALAACGLIAAAFGRRRERWSELAGRTGRELDIVGRLVEQLRTGVPLDQILGEIRRSFGLGAIVLRDAEGRMVAGVPIGSTPATNPQTQIALDTLLPADEGRLRFGLKGLRLPDGGGRLSVKSDGTSVSLDLWEGDPGGFDLNAGRTLTIAASILALEVSRRRAGKST